MEDSIPGGPAGCTAARRPPPAAAGPLPAAAEPGIKKINLSQSKLPSGQSM